MRALKLALVGGIVSLTIAPEADAGKAVKAKAPKRDQRGVKRDKRPDIGAFER